MNKPMKLLAIDTAANLCAACILDSDSGDPPVAKSLDVGKGHVELLMPLIGKILRSAEWAYADLDRIAVSTGPGSFTGVRVGVAAARGLALALEVPAVGISTLDAIAAETQLAFPDRPVLVALDARRGEIYAAEYDETGRCINEPAVSTVSDIALALAGRNPVLAGSAAPAIAARIDGGSSLPVGTTDATASIATFAGLGAGANIPEFAPKPVYLRTPDAKPQTGFAVERTGS